MSDYRLCRANATDVDRLHALLAVPAVNEYLVDGEVPPREAVVGWIEASHADFAAVGLGVWMLEDAQGALAGCVRLVLDRDTRTAELVYLLAPEAWGRGLATGMAATAIRAAFASGAVDRVFAGADAPNRRSIAVMERLGMRYDRTVTYPLGPGVEYALHAGDAALAALPAPLPLAEAAEPRGSA